MVNVAKPADQIITEDDTFIASALEHASALPLMMSVIHLTGDQDFLNGVIKPADISLLNYEHAVKEDEKKLIRRKALTALIAYRDGGCQAPPPPSTEAVYKMMSLIIGTEGIPKEYLPMLLDEVALDGIDRRAFAWTGGRIPTRAKKFHMLIIGAGMSGINAAIRLSEAGLSYTVIEKNNFVGGTWYENKYPGCRVDSWSHFYSYSFEPNHDWSELYSQRDELFTYFNSCVDKYDIRKHIRFSTEVLEAIYDEAGEVWRIKLRRPDGREEWIEANAVISAVGQLNRPQIPDFKGRETFKGPAFHSAQWEKHDLTGKRVAVIGTGASAFQLIPEVAKIAGELTVYQRAAGWMVPNPDYHVRVEEGKKWLLKHVPYYARWYRFLLMWAAGDGLLPVIRVDPTWNDPKSISAANEQMRIFATQSIVDQIKDRPDLIEKVVPKYPIFGKRILQDNGHYLRTYLRDNVELVTDGIQEIKETGIVDSTGRQRVFDVIIYATGFNANKFLWPMRIVGRQGAVLSDIWGDEPRAYLGITVPDFPNLFCLYGPGTNLGHAGSLILHSECQVRYALELLRALLESDKATVDCRRDVYEDYVQRLEKELAGTVWSHPSVNNWYKNSRGVVLNTSPWRTVDYWNWIKSANIQDYHVS